MLSEHSPLLYAIIDTLVGANIDSNIAAIDRSFWSTIFSTYMDTDISAISYTFVSSNQSADRGTYISAFVSAYMDTDISANDSSIGSSIIGSIERTIFAANKITHVGSN